MKTMNIYFKNGKVLCILVDDWKKDEDVFCFIKKEKVVACFMANNIIGIVES